MPEYRFDEIAVNSKEKKKPTEAEKYTYIGLEHLDTGSLTVNRWGSEIAPTGEKLVMHKGDVLFGKRRAYQKKVAIAPFDGIFSAHGMVLRPRENVITSAFFPLFISSDYFLDEAIKISVGSLSPTINWSDLKELRFQVPTIDEQKRLAPVIWAAIDTKNAYQKLLSSIDELVKSQFIEMFGEPFDSPKWPIRPIRDVAISMADGSNVSTSLYRASGAVVFLRIQNVWRNEIRFDDTVYITDEDNVQYSSSSLKKGDVLISKIGRINTKDSSLGRVALYLGEDDKANYSNNILRIRFRTEVNPRFANAMMNLDKYNLFIRNSCQGSTDKRALSKTLIGEYPMMIPPLALQVEYAAFVEQSDKSKFVACQTTITQLFTCMI